MLQYLATKTRALVATSMSVFMIYFSGIFYMPLCMIKMTISIFVKVSPGI